MNAQTAKRVNYYRIECMNDEIISCEQVYDIPDPGHKMSLQMKDDRLIIVVAAANQAAAVQYLKKLLGSQVKGGEEFL